MNTRKFIQALKNGEKEVVLEGLAQGLNADTCDENGEPALDIALAAGQTDMANLLLNPPELPPQVASYTDDGIAIVGMACRFAGNADNLDHFWQSLLKKEAANSTIPENRFVSKETYQKAKQFPGAYLKEDISQFDPEFFRISANEAHLMDPQQRMLLEESYHAFEHGGFNPQELQGKKVGVYVGQMTHDYMDSMRADSSEADARMATGNIGSVLSGRISYLYNFLGESLTLNTACSSSLVGVHLAANSLRDGKIDMALVAGVNAILDSRLMETADKAKMTSKDGRCKAFSANADGYGRGEGVGVLLFKRLADAKKDGDRILAVVRGSAVNQDGASSQLTAPSKTQQIAVIKDALKSSQLSIDQIDCIEAHGTGTQIGDQIEISALNATFSARDKSLNAINVSSVKANIGHCEAAAGVAGLIKNILALQNERLPGQALLQQLNPKLELSQTVLAIDTNEKDWKRDPNRPRRAGISSFGFSGTNTHVIIEEAPANPLTILSPQQNLLRAQLGQLIVFSAKSKESLQTLVRDYLTFLKNNSYRSDFSLADMAYTLMVGRAHYRFRVALICNDVNDLIAQLAHFDSSKICDTKGKLNTSPSAATGVQELAENYKAGYTIDFRAHWQNTPAQKVELPIYPFQRQSYWYNHVLSCQPRKQLAQPQQISPVYLTGGELVYQYRIDLNEATYQHLKQHQVAGEVIFPAAAYVDLIQKALRNLKADSVLTFKQIQFLQALALHEGTVKMCQLRLKPSANNPRSEFSIQITAWDEAQSIDVAITHAKATVMINAPQAQQTFSVPSLQNAADAKPVYQRLQQLGLSYGKDWQLLQQYSKSAQEVLVTLVENHDSETLVVRKLDAALQATILLINESELNAQQTLLPKSFTNFKLAGDLSAAAFIIATRQPNDKEIVISIELLDREGCAIASISQYLVGKTAKNQLVETVSPENCYQMQWQESELNQILDTSCHLTSGLDLRKTLANISVTDKLPKKDDAFLHHYSLLMMQMILVKRWPSLLQAHKTLSLKQPETTVKIAAHLQPLIEKCFDYVAKEGFVRIAGNEVTVLKSLPALESLRRELASMPIDKEDIQAVFLAAVGVNIEKVVAGEMDPVQVLFPKGESENSFKHAAAIYQQAKDAKLANALSANILAALSQYASDKPLRILEIGAGTGGTTRAILPFLKKFKHISYVYSDVSPVFAKACSDCFQGSGIANRFALLDVSRDPGEQGFAAAQFDLVIATNVLHATPNIKTTLSHVRKLLVEGGVSLISETVREAAWLDLTFGLTPGWWAFDDGVRKHSPLLSPEQWIEILATVGMPCQKILGEDQAVLISTASTAPQLTGSVSKPSFIFTFNPEAGEVLRTTLGSACKIVNLNDVGAISLATDLIRKASITNVYFIAPMFNAQTEEMVAYQEKLCKPLLTVMQLLQNRRATITVITQQAATKHPEQITATGLLASAAGENKQWTYKTIDIDGNLDTRLSQQIVQLSQQANADNEFVIRKNIILTAQLTPTPDLMIASAAKAAVAKGVALITGGTGEIGQALMQDLIAQGYKKFALLARTNAPLNKLPAGVIVKQFKDDLTHFATLSTTWQSIENELGKIESIYHLAGTLDDHLLAQMNWEAINNVFNAKVVGAYYLHKLSLNSSVQRFVLFSSVASFMASVGQMNHVAANRYLDTLAQMRHAAGLPALAINWGFWSQIGSAARLKADEAGKRKGFLALSPQQSLRALRQAELANTSNVVLANFDWPTYFNQHTAETPAIFRTIAASIDVVKPVKSTLTTSANLSELTAADLGQMILKKLCELLMLQDKFDDLDVKQPFSEFPVQIDSYANSQLVDYLNQLFGWESAEEQLTTNIIYSHENIEKLVATILVKLNRSVEKASVSVPLAASKMSAPVEKTANEKQNQAVAIIGMSVRFPSANNSKEFWNLLNSSVDVLAIQPAFRAGEKCYFNHTETSSHKPPKAGLLATDISQFDADFFNLSAEEVEVMDPQQRLLLELVWEALEHAAIAPSSLKDTNTSVIVGIAANEFGDLIVAHSEEKQLSRHHSTGNNLSATVGRISHRLGLKGANIAVNTACSSSLVSVNTACQSIQDGSTDLAICGAVNLILSPKQMKLYDANGMLSPTSHCHTFSNQADGMVRAEGCAIYILKSLEKAQLEGDRILAVIEGSAVNQNGASVSFMAPDMNAQRALHKLTLQKAKVKPEAIDWIETHGTGTKMGDPVEVEAIVKELATQNRKIPVGAVKTNIGHAEAAAGAAGLTKVILALQHGEVPPNHFDGEMNPLLNPFKASIQLLNETMPWPVNPNRPRRAMISSFGFSGTNGQVLLTEAPRISVSLENQLQQQWLTLQTQSPWSSIACAQNIEESTAVIIPISAKSETALRAQLTKLQIWLDNPQDENDTQLLKNLAVTLSKGRDHYAYRIAIQAKNLDDLKTQITAILDATKALPESKSPKKMAFLFTGQGSQYKNMSQELYKKNILYRSAFEHCAVGLKKYLDVSLHDIVFSEQAPKYLSQTTYAQPAIFALEYSLALMWMAYGVDPHYVMGHSVGEYVAATLAGVMSLEDGLKLICARGRIMEKTPRGKMLAVGTDDKTAQKILAENNLILDIAGINHPTQTVLSGSIEMADKAIAAFKAKNIQATALGVDKAFHSRLMDPILDEFRQVAQQITFNAPTKVTYISALNGEKVTQPLQAEYWVKHLREGVNFVAAMNTLSKLGVQACCEMGPKAILTTCAKRCLTKQDDMIWLEPLSDKAADCQQILNNLAKYYQAGGAVKWSAYWIGYSYHILDLPHYAFERKAYWPAVLGGVKQQLDVKSTASVVAEAVKPEMSAQEKHIIACAQAFAPHEITDLDKSFADYGGTSLSLPDFQSALYLRFNVHVSLPELSGESLRALAAKLPEQEVTAVLTAKADPAAWYKPFPLNPIQYAYWIGRQGVLPLGHVSAHGYLEVDMERIDIPKLQNALNKLIQRHHMLRMTVDDNGQQCVQENVPVFNIPVVDLRNASPQQMKNTLAKIRDELSHQVKAANVWPLFDVRIAHLKHSHILYLSFDSLIIDMYSMRLLFDEWYRLYMNESLELKPLEFSFRDYYFANEALKGSERYFADQKYWAQRIPHMPLGPELPLLCDPEQVKKQTFARCEAVIENAKWQVIKNKAKALNITPTTVLLTLFSVVLARYSANKEFLVNLTLFRRQQLHADVKNILGDFTNTEVFHCDPQNAYQIGFEQLVKQYHARLLADLEHANYDGVEVQREISKHHQLDGKKSVAPIVFTSLLNLNLERQGEKNHHHDSVWQQFGAVMFSTTQTPQIWIDHKTFESNEGLVVEWDYVEALFDAALMQQIHRDYVAFVNYLYEANWQQPLQDLITANLLPRMQKMNATRDDSYLQPTSLTALMTAQMQRTPDRVAVLDEKKSLTYAEFDTASKRVAASLQARGVKKGDYVAVSVERSCDMLIAIVGVLRAGAVYLPIENTLAADRREFMLKDSNAAIIIANKKQSEDWDNHLTKLLFIDDKLDDEKTLMPVDIHPQDLAYLLYTSGSTGNPKGVMIDHRAIVNRLLWMRDHYQIQGHDVIIQKTPIGFDVSIWELFLSLMSGASVFMAKPNGHKDVNYLYESFQRFHISRAHFVPSMLEIFIQHQDLTPLPKLTTVFCSGEALLPSQVNAFNQKFTQAQLSNLYGPTEAAVDVTYWDAPKTYVTKVPIGSPLSNVEVMILNRNTGLPCPFGVPGELYLAGVQVAQGYLNLPERTANAFVTNAYAQTAEGKRAYRTGDLAYLQADNSLVYLGRMDDQVKIRGQRIELGEVQTVLEQQKALSQVAVLAMPDEHKDLSLVAFVQQNQVPSKIEHQARLQSAITDPAQRRTHQAYSQAEFINTNSRGPVHSLTPNTNTQDLFKRKSYRAFNGVKLSGKKLTEFLHNKKPEVENTVSFALLKVLEDIAAFKDDSLIKPKYPYPSAGSIYPVKCYLAIGKNEQGITPGYYYYNQIKHCLESCQMSAAFEKEPKPGIEIALVAHKRLIEPLYGEYWESFSHIEAGYIKALLSERCQTMGQSLQNSTNSTWVRHLAFVSSDDQLCAIFSPVANTLQLKSDKTNDEQIWVYLSDKMPSMKAGLYNWDGQQLLQKENDLYPLALNSEGENASVVAAASAILFFTNPSASKEGLLKIGQQLMSFMQSSASQFIGVCPLGVCPIPKEYAQTIGSPVILNAAIGPISPEQMNAIETSTMEKPAETLASYLQRTIKTTSLTEAMHPARFITVASFPTTNNGKIDRKALIKLAEQSNSALSGQMTTPRNELEKKMHAIWCEVLRGTQYDVLSSFLTVGGNSLKINELSASLRKHCNIAVSVATIYENITIERLAKFVDSKQDLDWKQHGPFALLNLVESNNKALVEKFLTSGKVDVNKQDTQGRTALYLAAQLGKEEMVQLLLKHGANAKIGKQSGTTPLQCAERQGYQNIVTILNQHESALRSAQSSMGLFKNASNSNDTSNTLSPGNR